MKKYSGFILVILLSFWAVKSLLVPGFFPMHDDTGPSRIYEMAKSLSVGQIPVRFVSDLGYGYGYPIFNFYAPLAYYVGAFFLLFGVTAISATKIIIIIPILLSGIFMYILGKELFGKYGGIVSAVSYVYAPYHALDIYVRGDIAELWAYSFIPLVFYSVWKIAITEKRRFVFLGAGAYALLILSHNLTALMASGFLLLFVIFLILVSLRQKHTIRAYNLVYFLVLGILLSSFYWIPALLEMGYTNVLSQVGGGADFRDHFVCINQLWNSPWGFGGSTAGCIDGMSFKIGKFSIILVGLAVFFTILLLFRKMVDYWYVINPKGFVFVGAVLGFLLSVFLTLEVSKPIWDLLPTMAFFQYPWRFLLFVAFFSSVLSGFCVWLFTKSIFIEYHSKYFVYSTTGIVAGLLIVSSYTLFAPQKITYRQNTDYVSQSALIWDISKISDEYLPKHFEKPNRASEIPSSPVEFLSEKGSISSVLESPGFVFARFSSETATEIRINKAYFPFWHVFLDSEEKNVIISGKGMVLKVPKGNHEIVSKIQSTFVESFANAVSAIGFLILIIDIIFSIQKKRI